MDLCGPKTKNAIPRKRGMFKHISLHIEKHTRAVWCSSIMTSSVVHGFIGQRENAISWRGMIKECMIIRQQKTDFRFANSTLAVDPREHKIKKLKNYNWAIISAISPKNLLISQLGINDVYNLYQEDLSFTF